MKLLQKIFREEFTLFFASPALLWQLLFLYIPLFIILLFSFSDYATTGNLLTSWTLVHYAHLFKLVYFKVLLNSLSLAVLTSLFCFMIGYPVAYFLAFHVRRFRTLLLFSLILPSWANFIVQVYAWFFLLERGGVLSQVVYFLGLTSRMPHMVNTYFSTVTVMVYCFLPFFIFPVFAVLEKMDRKLIEASADLGGSRMQTFCRIIFPLSLPGVYAGLLLVFVPAFGEFVVPMLLGGSKNMYWGSVIVEKFLISRDWASGFAFASMGIIFLISSVLLVVALISLRRVVRLLKVKASYRKFT